MSRTGAGTGLGSFPCRRFFELTPDPVVVADSQGLLRGGNPAWARSAGTASGKAGLPLADFFLPRDRAAVRGAIRKLASGSPSAFFRARLKGDGAAPREFTWSLTSCPEDGSFLGIGREAAPERGRDDRFRIAVESAPNAMMVVAPGGKIVQANAEAEKLFGYSRRELLDLSVDDLVPGRFRARHSALCGGYFAEPRPRAMGSGRDLCGLRKDGREIPVEIGLNPMSTGEGTFAMVSLVDLTKRKRREERLRKESLRDPLTGLYNRRYLEATLDREIHRCGRKKRPLAVIFMDVDRFKRFNDVLGHAAGDTILRQTGRLLETGTRRGDIACRYGGEEFVLVLPETGAESALRRAEELRREAGDLRLRGTGQAGGRITFSIGVASFPAHGASSRELLEAADRALYRAKRAGRNRAEMAK